MAPKTESQANIFSPGQVLTQQFAFLKKQNPRVSVRSFADKLELSVAFLSRVLKDQTPFPVKRFLSFVDVFKLDDISKHQLLEAIAYSILQRSFFSELPVQKASMTRLFSSPSPLSSLQNLGSDYELISSKDFDILSKWYILAILDLTTCKDFQPDPVWIARRLRLKADVVDRALRHLLAKGYLVRTESSYTKKDERIRFPVRSPAQTVREFHGQMMRKAESVMSDPTEDYQQRLINGIVFAADPKRIEEAKSILDKALYDIAELMSEGECTEVYYVAGHLFPLTRS